MDDTASHLIAETADPAPALSATGKPLTKRGEATRRKLLEAAEQVFASLGYHEASIVKITERAGIGLGTFYLYFDSKQQIFEELVVDLNRRVRHSMSEAMAGASGRIEAERAGFEGFFRFTAAHPALYRIVREAEFVSPEMLRLHYTRIVDGYEAGLRAAQRDGEVDAGLDPEVTAWALMGAGELIGMRYLLWERDESGAAPTEMPDAIIDHMTRFIRNALDARRTPGGGND
ncbi:TetR/AcrR family transcriptional regulator [Microbacterium flavum]|uniref:TetR/AcrR family transcriptional regulator n=1 Tax=Microbacterium flavum TaxID=415216 RepID=A0ABS5XSB9_9MICO|nr:TetR/AcrR family transcriptional regulator [Microbacterium flavum]MBT8797414.1 TetR/AcrR family transcriptional regulator [Microbacterium flavum]